MGPGTVPLIVQARTRCPLTTSHMTCLAVMVKCLAPSGSMVYANGWLPEFCVALGTFGEGVACVLLVVIESVLLVELVVAGELPLLGLLVIEAPMPYASNPTINTTAINSTASGEVIPRHQFTLVVGVLRTTNTGPPSL